MKKHRLAMAVGALVIATLASASSWEGSAMVGSYGDFPPSGFYAACNSFPRNTSVEVVNLENGRSVTVLVTRGLESSGVFMMLSVEAAGAVGLVPGKVARVRASSPKSAVELAPASPGAAFDPDLNPRQLAAQELRRLGYELKPSGEAVFAERPAVSGLRVEPEARTAPAAKAPEPVPPAVKAPEPASSAAKAPERPSVPAEAPAAIGLDTPGKPRAADGSLPVAEPQPKGAERPESLASAKPRPVRTIVLPQLPEPGLPAPKAEPAEEPVAAPGTALPETPVAPEVVAIMLPEPDETPLRVEAPVSPRRYEAPALRPEASSLARRPADSRPASVALAEPSIDLGVPPTAAAIARVAPGYLGASAEAELRDPLAPAESRAESYGREAPALTEGGVAAALYDPSAPAGERAMAFARAAPSYAEGRPWPELAWPELEADEIPEVVLAGLSSPALAVPPTSLAEGEVKLPSREGPLALGLESPAYAAAETRVALEDAEAEDEETPSVELAARLDPAPVEGEARLAEAETQPSISTRGGPAPLGDPAIAPLAEAEPGAGPEAVASGREVPDAPAGAELAEASEQKPETAPYVGPPSEAPAPGVDLSAPEEYVVTLEPASPKPPVSAPETKAIVAKEPAAKEPEKPIAPAGPEPARAASAVTASPLEKGRYYIQIGAFASQAAASENVAGLRGGFPTLIQRSGVPGKETWRVFVGPLSRDESGVALVRVRALGYKDAFVKSGS